MIRYVYIHALIAMTVAAIGFAVTAGNMNSALYKQKQETLFQEFQAKMYREERQDLQALVSLLFRSDLEQATQDRLREFVGRHGKSAIHCKIWDLGKLSGVPSNLAGLSFISVSEDCRDENGVRQKSDGREVASILYSNTDDRIVDIRILKDSIGMIYGGFGVQFHGLEDGKPDDVWYEVTPSGFRRIE